MHTKTKLELLRRLRQRNSTTQAFTLVELVVVVAIIAVLSAVAVPQFLGTRNAAQASAKVAEQIGLAKECGAFLTGGGIGSNPNAGCSTSSGGTYTASWDATVSGLSCMGVTSASAGNVSVVVSTTGAMSCTLS